MRCRQVAFVLLSACTQTKRERCIESDNHVADIVIDYWMRRPDAYCLDQERIFRPDGPDPVKFVKCRLWMMTPEGRAGIDKFARVGTGGAVLDYCERYTSDDYLDCRLRANTFDEVGKCDAYLKTGLHR